MLRATMMTKTLALASLVSVAMALAPALWGCGKQPTAYEDPNASITTTLTPTALIDAATLKQWMDEGKVNNTDPNSRDRVVIVTVAKPSTYAANHIPLSVSLQITELTEPRLEAVAPLASEPPGGPAMDELVDRLGIDGRTTVVFTVSGGQSNWPYGLIYATRAYFTFRYWGFPKERLKVLNGGDDAWTAAGFTLTAEAPVVARCGFTVQSNYKGSDDCLRLRTAIGPMIDIVDRVNSGALSVASATGISILDARGGVNPATGPFLANASLDDYAKYYDTIVPGKTPALRSAGEMVDRLATFGVTAAKTMTYVYCTTGFGSSTLFFILDGVLGWPVTLYDGSATGQWFAYREASGVGAAWRVDLNSPGTLLPRTFGTITTGLLTLDPTANALFRSVTDRRANQIFLEDRAYFSGKGGGGGGGPAPPPPGPPSGC